MRICRSLSISALLVLLSCLASVPSLGQAESISATDDILFNWTNQGYILLSQYKHEDALNAFNNALNINKSYAVAWAGKGSALRHMGNYSEALQAYDKALELNPEYIRVWIGRGSALLGMGNYSGALQSYEKAIKLDPMDANAWNAKAWLLYKRGQYDQAIESAAWAIEIQTADLSATLDTEGMALLGLGKYEEALGYINRSIDMEPLDAILWIHKGDILKAIGRQAEADAAYNQSKLLPEQYLGGESV
ncbi:Photosystem I assembly protein Ycf3 [uncultured archaeon]|nr:Photosystem I assembly protein Ycf3 [uncultured archaeon]